MPSSNFPIPDNSTAGSFPVVPTPGVFPPPPSAKISSHTLPGGFPITVAETDAAHARLHGADVDAAEATLLDDLTQNGRTLPGGFSIFVESVK